PGNSTRRSLTSSRSVVTASVARLMLGIERIADPIADEVDGEHRDEDRKTRETDGPPIVDEARARQGGHQPPFGRWRPGAGTDEAERGRRQDGITEGHGALHDDRRERVRQGVPQYDADIPNAHGPRGRDVQLAVDPHDRAPNDARVPGEPRYGQRHHGVEQPA